MRQRLEAGRIWGRGIEWEAALDVLSQEARTAMGRERALAAQPLTDSGSIQAALDTTGEARQALEAAGPPPLDVVPDIRPVLERARMPGSVLDGAELIQIAPVLEASPRLAAYGRGVRELAPAIGLLTDALPRLPELRDALRRALDEEGAVTDQASPRLGQLRRLLRDRRRRIVSELERMVQASDAVADRFVTVRHGRYVIPVRADARARVRGIVHDRSQSGQTVFVEPEALIEANNELVETERAEEQEVQRILAELTDRVRERLDEVTSLVGSIGELDWIFCRAHLAERMQATRPLTDPGGTVELRAARHPLLLAQSWKDATRAVVPVDLELSRQRPLLLVTGPNAGGKTVALKTLALCALLAQLGCHVPAAEGSRLPVFDGVFAIVGDDQSVANHLSTFSAFVTQARAILELADERSLVLLDELGAGTDPDEGAALAQAILEQLEARGALVMATTHLEPLKAFASTHPGARNASVEFDGETLAPTFRLLYDRPGQSYALSIAARFGLSPELVARAHAHRSVQGARMSELLERLDVQSRTEAARAIALDRREQEVAARLLAAQDAEASAEARARTIVERAKREATTLVADIRRALAAEWERLKTGERTRKSVEQSRRRVAVAAERLAPPHASEGEQPPGDLVPGATVVADHLGLRGELVALTGGTATVRSPRLTVRVPVGALRAVTEPVTPPPRARGGTSVPTKSGVTPELHLIGRTTDEARDLVEHYLDDAFLAGLPTVRLVHGKGTGALRKTVRDLLTAHPLVESFREGEPSEGGAGATVAALRVS
jgi:DNA mismatch repair protein MutS2